MHTTPPLATRGEAVERPTVRLVFKTFPAISLILFVCGAIMSMATGSKAQFEPGSWGEALHDVYIGTITGATHSFYLVVKWW